MGRPVSLLEGLCGHALSLGANSLEVEYKDRREWVLVPLNGVAVPVAKYAGSGADASELRGNLKDALKRPVRTTISGRVYILTARVVDDSERRAVAVSVDLAPPLDPAVAPAFTRKQGQYLAYIYNYAKIHHQAPSEPDLQRYFRVSPPAIHEMIKTLERNGLIEKIPGVVRSIRLLVKPEHLPRLE